MKNRFSNFSERPSENKNTKMAAALKAVSQNLATISEIITDRKEEAHSLGRKYDYNQDEVVMKLINETQKLALNHGIILALPLEEMTKDPFDKLEEELEDDWNNSGCSGDEWNHSSC